MVAKFGGSAIGPFGESVPEIVGRIGELGRDSRVIAVFSAPLTMEGGERRSLTDVVLRSGAEAERGVRDGGMDLVRETYGRILGMVSAELRPACRDTVERFLGLAEESLARAGGGGGFADEVRSRALGFSGELLMSGVMDFILRSNGVSSAAVDFENWPIITDGNIESTNFLASESQERLGHAERLVAGHRVVCMGGFIGRTPDGTATTYERGGSDRTAADVGILFHRKYDTRIDFEKDSSVVSADPKIVGEGLTDVGSLSYNEARLAGMFGMKILDPIAIKEILENGVDIPITVTDMRSPGKATTIERSPRDPGAGHPLKIVTGRRNCAIIRMEGDAAQGLLSSLEHEKRYSEYVILSPFTRDGIGFARILFLDGDYVRRNEKYLLGFDSLASITYNRGVVTLIGDQMWRVQQIASRASSSVGEVGLNILNMDAQEETSRIILVVEDSGDSVARAVRAIHSERPRIRFV